MRGAGSQLALGSGGGGGGALKVVHLLGQTCERASLERTVRTPVGRLHATMSISAFACKTIAGQANEWDQRAGGRAARDKQPSPKVNSQREQGGGREEGRGQLGV